jgi:hypothetical protein
MELIFRLIGFACMAFLVVDLIDTVDTNNKVHQKPFKCTLCMGFWLSVIPLTTIYGLDGILAAAVVGVSAETLDRQMNKM